MTKKKTTKAVTLPSEKHLEALATRARIQKARQCPGFKDGRPLDRNGQDELLAFGRVMDICKTDEIDVAIALVKGAAAGQLWGDKPDDEKGRVLAHMAELKPETPLEAMLISQIIAVNTAITKTLHNALLPEQTPYGKETNMSYATKLQRTFLQQIDALQKLRGKGQQTVRVEHVTVNAGGQAIVGHVEQKTGGGKDGE
jgi:hypothetical protein